jgi:uncharacterized protein YjiS (DUF1127 family)
MRTTDCGTDLDLLHEPHGAQGRFALVLVRAKFAWRALRNRMSASSLHEMDDRQLDDIGITRHDVVAALERSGLLDDPSLLLSRAARQRSLTRFSRPARR